MHSRYTPDLIYIFCSPSRCVCDPSSLPLPVPSPIPVCPSLLERPRQGDASNQRSRSDWTGSWMTAGMFQTWSRGEEEREGERKMNDWVLAKEKGSVRAIQKRKGDRWQCVCKDLEQETGLWQTQHPAADISSQAALESHSVQWQPSMETPPSPWVNKDGKNSIHPAGIPQDGRCQMGPIKTHYWW